MGHRNLIHYAGGDSASGHWNAEQMWRKWTRAMRKSERDIQGGPLGALGLFPDSAIGVHVDAWSTDNDDVCIQLCLTLCDTMVL